MVKPLDYTVEKWLKEASEAVEYYRKGIELTERDWASALLAAKERILRGLEEAIRTGRFDKGVKEVGTEGWRKAALEKGTAHYVDGIRTAKDKYAAKMEVILRYEADLQKRIEAMPRDTLEQRIARALTWMREMAKLKGKV